MSSMLQPQIILLKEGTDTSQGKSQLISNINACTAVADAVRPTLGPRGMDKLIHADKGNTTISNDGATIMKLLEIVHPAAKVVVDIAKSQDSEVGDGTTTVMLLAGEILKEAKPFIEDGVHPQNLIRSYRTASYLAIEKIRELALSIEGKSLDEKKGLLAKCAETTLSSKLIGGEKEFFASMVVDAVISIGNDDRLNMIGINKVPGGTMRDSFLVDDVAFKKTFSYAGFEQQPKKFIEPKVLLLNIELELKSEKENAEIRLSDPSQYQSVVDAEWNIIYDKLDKCVASGAKIVLSRLAIGDLGTQYFADRDIFCAGRVTEEDLQRVAAATGGTVQTSVNIVIDEVLGSCALFEEKQVGNERFNIFSGCPLGRTAIIVLRGGADQVFGEKTFEKYGNGLISMHFSDQHLGTQGKMLQFKFALPYANNMADMTRLIALVPYYIDLIGRYKLSSQARSKTDAARAEAAQEACKKLQKARHEALQQKKAKKQKKAEKKVVEEGAAKLRAEALRKREAKECVERDWLKMRFLVVGRFVLGLVSVVLLSLATFPSPSCGYDPLDPSGNITVKWDILDWYDATYDARVMIMNYQLFRHIESPGWKLQWTWQGDEVIWSMEGSVATRRGRGGLCNSNNPPHCCLKRPSIVDLPLGAPYNVQVANCCRGGVLSTITQDNTTYLASFQMNVGSIGVYNVSSYPMPTEFDIGVPGYTCGLPFEVAPSRFPAYGGRRYTEAVGTWNVTCTFSQFQASLVPTCCVSLSAFYSENIVRCPKCSCGCPDTLGNKCVDPNEENPVIKLPADGLSPVLRCSRHMCPIRVHWHVKISYQEYWRVKITIENLNYAKNYSEWNLVVVHPNLRSLTQIFSFQYQPLVQYGEYNDTGMFYGLEHYNDMLLQSGSNGSVQTEMLLHKDTGVFSFEDGWAFPRKISFNGQDCVMPNPEDFPKLPKKSIGSFATLRCRVGSYWWWSFVLITVVLLLHSKL